MNEPERKKVNRPPMLINSKLRREAERPMRITCVSTGDDAAFAEAIRKWLEMARRNDALEEMKRRTRSNPES